MQAKQCIAKVKLLGRKDTYFHLILFLLLSDILNWNMTGTEITESVIKKSTKRLNHNHSVLSLSDPDRIQTCNLLIRSQMLYSVEPRGLSLNCDAKVRSFFESTKCLPCFF